MGAAGLIIAMKVHEIMEEFPCSTPKWLVVGYQNEVLALQVTMKCLTPNSVRAFFFYLDMVPFT